MSAHPAEAVCIHEVCWLLNHRQLLGVSSLTSYTEESTVLSFAGEVRYRHVTVLGSQFIDFQNVTEFCSSTEVSIKAVFG